MMTEMPRQGMAVLICAPLKQGGHVLALLPYVPLFAATALLQAPNNVMMVTPQRGMAVQPPAR